MSLLISCDDYGLTESVNNAICELSHLQTIDTVSIMCHKEAVLSDVIDISPNVLKGLHIVLTQEKAENDKISLFTKNSNLPSTISQLFKLIVFSPQILKEFEVEIEKQVQRYLSLFPRIEFINSHQHVHLIPPLFSIFKKIQKKYSIKYLRCPQRLTSLKLKQLAIEFSSAISSFRFSECEFIEPINIDLCGHIGSDTFFKSIDRMLSLSNNRRTEIIFHPSVEDEKKYSFWNYQWYDEYRFLKSAEFLQWKKGTGSL